MDLEEGLVEAEEKEGSGLEAVEVRICRMDDRRLGIRILVGLVRKMGTRERHRWTRTSRLDLKIQLEGGNWLKVVHWVKRLYQMRMTGLGVLALALFLRNEKKIRNRPLGIEGIGCNH